MLRTLNTVIDNLLINFSFISIFFLRLALGLAFIFHGWSKFPLPPQKLIDYFNFNPLLANFIAISEVSAGFFLIIAGLSKSYLANILTRLCSLTIVIIMIFAFYLAHMDWFFNEKLFTSEQIFLFFTGLFFFINGNKNFKR